MSLLLAASLAAPALGEELTTCGDTELTDCYATLADAIAASSIGDTIHLSPGEYAEAVVIDHDLRLVGQWTAALIDPPDAANVITVTGGVVTLSQLVVTTTRARPVAVYGADVWLDGGTYHSSGAQQEGGLVRVEGGSLEIHYAALRDGTAVYGGQVFAIDSDLVIDGGTARGGRALVDGGCVEVRQPRSLEVKLQFTSLEDCAAERHGGGVHVIGPGSVLFDQSHVTASAAVSGGGAYLEGVTASTILSSFRGNRAVADLHGTGGLGGGLVVRSADPTDQLQMYETSFIGNWASVSGGGASVEVEYAQVADSMFLLNEAARGGALVLARTDAVVTGNRFYGNVAAERAGALGVASFGSSGFGIGVGNNVFGGNRVEAGPGGAIGFFAADRADPVALFWFNTFLLNQASDASVLDSAPGPASFANNLVFGNVSDTSAVFRIGIDADLSYNLFEANGGAHGAPAPIDPGWGITGDAGVDGWTVAGCLPADVPGVLSRPYPDLAWPAWGYAGRDAADPAMVDADGTRADIGAHGGPGFHTPFYESYWGLQDENGAAELWRFDSDGDGFPAIYDCAPDDRAVHPDAEDAWYDGVDRNCDGRSDFDRDRDGHDAQAHGGDDCDDGDAAISPEAAERPLNSIDEDCSGAALIDADADGWPFTKDCDDLDATIHPAQDDARGDVDGNCDDQVATLVGRGCAAVPASRGLAALLGLAATLARRRRPAQQEVRWTRG